MRAAFCKQHIQYIINICLLLLLKFFVDHFAFLLSWNVNTTNTFINVHATLYNNSQNKFTIFFLWGTPCMYKCKETVGVHFCWGNRRLTFPFDQIKKNCIAIYVCRYVFLWLMELDLMASSDPRPMICYL